MRQLHYGKRSLIPPMMLTRRTQIFASLEVVSGHYVSALLRLSEGGCAVLFAGCADHRGGTSAPPF